MSDDEQLKTKAAMLEQALKLRSQELGEAQAQARGWEAAAA